MGLANVGEVAVFEQFIPIADFDVGVAFVVVVLESVAKQHFVVNKIVRPGTIAAMGIAEEDQTGMIVEGNTRGFVEKVGQVVLCGFEHGLIGFFLCYQMGVISLLTGGKVTRTDG